MHSDIFLEVLLTNGEAVFHLLLDEYSDSQAAIMQAIISGFGHLLQWFFWEIYSFFQLLRV
jgi:hypothetical protein